MLIMMLTILTLGFAELNGYNNGGLSGCDRPSSITVHTLYIYRAYGEGKASYSRL